MTRRDVAWLAGQALVLVVVMVVLPLADGGPGRIDVPGARVVGIGVVGAGGVLGVVAMRQLGRQLVPQPTPVADGTIIDRGLYGVVRHPIYTALLVVCVGVVLAFASVTGIVVLAMVAVFLDRKSAHEEILLRAVHPTYAAYVARVPWKLVPGIR